MSAASRPASGREARGTWHGSHAALSASSSRPRTAKARIERATQRPAAVVMEPAWPRRAASSTRREPTLAALAPPARRKALRLSKSAGGSIETTSERNFTSPPPKPIRPASGHHSRRTLTELLQRDSIRSERSMPRNLTGALVAALRRDLTPTGAGHETSSPRSSAGDARESPHSGVPATLSSSACLRGNEEGSRPAAGSSPPPQSPAVRGKGLVAWTRRSEGLDTVACHHENTGNELVEVLGSSALMGPLASLESNRLLEALDFILCLAGEVVVHQGQPEMDGMYFVFEGKAHAAKTSLRNGLTRKIRSFVGQSRQRLESNEEHSDEPEDSEDGESVLPRRPETENLWRYEAVDYFGEFAFWKRQPVSYSVICETDCKLVKIQRDMLERLGVFEDMVQQLHIVRSCLNDSRLRQQFELFDADSDGLLTVHEAWRMMCCLGCGCSWTKFQRGFSRLDSAWPDFLCYDDFYEFWQTCSLNDPFGVAVEEPTSTVIREGSRRALLHEDPEQTAVLEKEARGFVSVVGSTHPKTLKMQPRGRGAHTSIETGAVSIWQSDQQAALRRLLESFAEMASGASEATTPERLSVLCEISDAISAAVDEKVVSRAMESDDYHNSLISTIADGAEDDEVRRAAARIVQGYAQRCDSAAARLLAADLNAQMGRDKSRSSWRRSGIGARSEVQPHASGHVPDMPAVFSVFKELGCRSVDMIAPARERSKFSLSSVAIARKASKQLSSKQLTKRMPARMSRSHSPVRSSVSCRRPARSSISPIPRSRDSHPGRRSSDVRHDPSWSTARYLFSDRAPDVRRQHDAAGDKLDLFLKGAFSGLCDRKRQLLRSMMQVDVLLYNDCICHRGQPVGAGACGRTCFYLLYEGTCVTTDEHKRSGLEAKHVLARLRAEEGRACDETGDALSAGRTGRELASGDVFGLDSVAEAHQGNHRLQEHMTCLAASRLCTIFRIPYEAYISMVEGEEEHSNLVNEHDRATRIQKMFNKFDYNSDGLMDAAGMAELCAYMGIKCDVSLAERICANMTDGPDCLISLENFSAWWEQVNVFNVEEDMVMHAREAAHERARTSALLEQVDRDKERRRVLALPAPAPPKRTVFYDEGGHKHVVSPRGRADTTLSTHAETLRTPKEPTVGSVESPQSWRAFLPPPDPANWTPSINKSPSPFSSPIAALRASPLAAAARTSPLAAAARAWSLPAAASRRKAPSSSPHASPLAAARPCSRRQVPAPAAPAGRPIPFPFPELIAAPVPGILTTRAPDRLSHKQATDNYKGNS